MPAVAAVLLNLTANTASATRGVDALRGQLASLQKDAGGVLSRLQAQGAARAAGAVVGASRGLWDAVRGADRERDLADKAFGVLEKGASEAGKLAAAFAPFGPVAAGAAGAIGALTGAIGAIAEESKKSAEEIARAEKADKEAKQTFVDARVAHELEWRNASDEERAKMQHEARERMKNYRYAAGRGATVTEKAVFDAANWDRKTTAILLEEYRRQHGGELSDALKPIGETIRNMDVTNAMGEAMRRATEMFGPRDKWEDQLEAADRLEELVRRITSRKGREEGLGRVARMRAEANERLRKWDEQVAPYNELFEQMSDYMISDESFDFYKGKSAHGGAFVAALDTLWEAMQAGKGDSGKPSGSPRGAAFQVPAPSGVDSLSSAGIGFTGADPMRREQVELLRSISETLRTIQGRGIPAVAV